MMLPDTMLPLGNSQIPARFWQWMPQAAEDSPRSFIQEDALENCPQRQKFEPPQKLFKVTFWIRKQAFSRQSDVKRGLE